jgi:hypothetical protein
MKRIALFLCSGMFFYTLQAAPVTPQEALSRIETSTISKSKALNPTAGITLQRTINADDGLPAVYIFGNDTQLLFVSADDQAKPVLGRLDNVPAADVAMPVQLESWLAQISEDIMAARATTSSTSSVQLTTPEENDTLSHVQPRRAIARATSANKSIAPLLTTTWAQSAPYNNDCPVLGDNSEHALTGCVATAMAQIIAHNRYPQTSTGTGTASDGSTMNLNISYDYDNMLDSYTTNSYNATQANAVSKLCAACGYAAQMTYGLDGSGAYSGYAAVALKDNFLYSNAEYMLSSLYTKEDWSDMIYDNLSHGYPIYYSGTARDYGHAFVLDGYEYDNGNDYYHFNWGWSGYYNGYFLIDYMLPAGDFHRNQAMIINIVPSTDSYYCEVTRAPYINEMGIDDDGSVYYTIFGPTVGDSSFDIYYYLVNFDTGYNKIINPNDNLTFKSGGTNGYKRIYTLSDNLLSKLNLSAGQTYQIYPIFRAGDTYYYTPYNRAASCGYYLATVSENGVSAANITYSLPTVTMPEVELNALSYPIYLKSNSISSVNFTGKITNNSEEDIYQVVRPVLLRRDGSSLYIVGEGQTYLVWLQAGESKDLSMTSDFKLTDNFTAGNYEIAFAPYNYNYTVSNLINAEVQEYTGLGKVSVTKFTTGYANEQVPFDNIAFDVQLTCTEGLYDYYSYIYLYIFDNSSGSWQQSEYYYYYYKFNIPAGQTASYRQVFTPQNAKAGMLYVALIYNFTYEDGKYSAYEATRIQSTFGASADTNGIDDITTDVAAPDINLPVYDLTGRMVAPRLAEAQLPAGIYIVGNKKVSIR